MKRGTSTAPSEGIWRTFSEKNPTESFTGSLGDKSWRRGHQWFSVHEVVGVTDRRRCVDEDPATLTECLRNPESGQNLVVARSNSREQNRDASPLEAIDGVA